MSKDSKQQPMDPSARETATPEVATNAARVAYALKTLVAEVLALFPETPHEFGDVDGRNTALSVTFDTTPMDGLDRDAFTGLLDAVKTDARVAEVTSEDDLTYMLLRASARTQDDRSSFDLADIWLDMNTDHEGFAGGSGEPDEIEAGGKAAWGGNVGQMGSDATDYVRAGGDSGSNAGETQ